MTPFAIVVCVLCVALVATLAWVLRRERQRIERALAEVLRLSGDLPSVAESAAQGERISIELLNPMQLAAQQSRFADRFGALTPQLVRRMVYQRAAAIVREQLRAYGAEAEVRVHRA